MKIETIGSLAKQHEQKERLAKLHTEAQSYAGIRQGVFAQMLERGERKYKWFLRGIGIFKHLTDSPEQGGVIENFYVAMRYIDDVADGDIPPPPGYENPTQYIEGKIKFVEADSAPQDDIEKLLALSFKMGSEFGHNYHEETKDILNCLLFDAKRRGKYEIFDQKTLHAHFHVLDIRGTINGTLRVVGENPDLYNTLEPLGEAVRIYYNLRDFRDDAKVGLINVSSEDCARLAIPREIFSSGKFMDHPGIRMWFQEQATKGLSLIDEYHKIRKGVSIRPVTRATLKLAFEIRAKAFMTKVARGHFEEILNKTSSAANAK